MNRTVLSGRLTRDPDIRHTKTQKGEDYVVARYTLAVDRRFKREGDEQTADFISCVAFGKNGEFVEKYLSKGKKISVDGHIQTGSYTDRDGKKIYTTEVVVEYCEFAESRKDTGGESGAYPKEGQTSAATSENQDTEYPTAPVSTNDDGFMNIPEGLADEFPYSGE